MSHRRLTLLFFATFLGNTLWAQAPAHLPGQVLVSLHAEAAPQVLARRMENDISVPSFMAKKVSKLLNVWLLETDSLHEQKALEWLYWQPEVRMAQFNFLVSERRSPHPNIFEEGIFDIIPNDPFFSQQWQYVNTGANGGVPNADLDADMAWDITAGGLSSAGDTIVVAVIDGGIDLNHSDLVANLWKNWGEIPNDYADNDGNGYVDDFRGWNVYAGNDNILGVSTGHGTPVSAIVGAKGNNNNGVAGINWNVKIMFVAGSGNQANILAAYDYVWQARLRYNATNGQSGAFVVAANNSFGINYGQPSNAPLWCAAFDSLGAAGIVSVAATANIPVDVDEVGDLPTTCPSDFLLSVTSLTKSDAKAPNAAWGATHIDLGAYGQEVFTAAANNSYAAQSGTSFAAPQVAGAIGLLYSSPCPNLIALAKSNPAGAALWAKNLVQNSVIPNTTLQGTTLSGGRLNLWTMLRDYEDQCSPCPAPFALHVLDITTQSALLKWSEIADFQTVTLYWRQAGATNWNILDGVQNAYLLQNLTPCTNYEFALSATCWQGTTSDWSALVSFKTDGCCEPPGYIWTEWTSSTEAALHWQNVTAATSYRLRVRPEAGGSWTIHDLSDANNSFVLSNLLPCIEYEAQVQTICNNNATAYSNSCFFKTTGCGSCTEADYCPAKAEFANEEWIASVQIDNWTHISAGGNGYENFTGDQISLLQIAPQIPLDVTITPGYSGNPYQEHFRIFVDFNMDGDFDDPSELAFAPGWASDAPVSGLLAVPDFSMDGLTRMRVMMKYKSVNDPSPPMPCEMFEFGQVEDYCVRLSTEPLSTGWIDAKKAQLLIYPQPAREEVWLELPKGSAEGEWKVSAWDMAGRQVFSGMGKSSEHKIIVATNEWPAGVYLVKTENADNVFTGKLLKH